MFNWVLNTPLAMGILQRSLFFVSYGQIIEVEDVLFDLDGKSII